MVKLTLSEPLKIIQNLNICTLNHLDKINIIVNNQPHKDDTYNKNQDISDAINQWFSHHSATINHAYKNLFFPALIESMAGSDAICIKDMTNHYLNESQHLDHIWQQKIAREIKQTIIQPKSVSLIQDWLNSYKQILILCNDELVPMAERLLDADKIQELELYFNELNKNIFTK